MKMHYLIVYEYPAVALFGTTLRESERGEIEVLAFNKPDACKMFLVEKPGARIIAITRM